MKWLVPAVAALFLASPGLSQERRETRSYYVSPSGNDANPGTLAQPFKTLQKALPLLKPGETLIVRAGEYDTGLGINGALSHNGASIIPQEGPGIAR
jgi:hypothetical protein